MKKTIITDLREHIDSRIEYLGIQSPRDFLEGLDLSELMRYKRTAGIEENISGDMGALWARYIAACLEGAETRVDVNGEEYGVILNRRTTDPRAAAMYFDLRLHVLPDGTYVGGGDCALSAEGGVLSDIILTGIRHEIACLRRMGSIPGYPENILSDSGESWEQYSFAHDSCTAELPDYVRTVRIAMLRVPDAANVVALPRPEPLAEAN
ncbi:MAG: hypothetical protein RR314_05655 [Oscillospiraceae bacterium]